MKTDPSHKAIDQKCHAGQITDIFKNSNKKKKYCDLRYEHDDVPYSSNDAVSHQVREGTRDKNRYYDRLDGCGQTFDRTHNWLRPAKQCLKKNPHNRNKYRKTQEPIS